MTNPSQAAPLKTPVCAECEESIRYIPGHGFGQPGNWQHYTLPANPGHMARPKVFIT